jgi:hypothetical protein
MFLTLVMYFYNYNFYCNINCNVGLHRKNNTRDALKLIRRYFILQSVMYKGLMMA